MEYRIYTLGTDDHFIGCEPLICRDDDEAQAKARAMVDGHDLELWSGDRFILRLKSRGEA